MMFVIGYLVFSAALYAVLSATAMPVGVPEIETSATTGEVIYLPFAAEDERKAA
ncbi:MAG: hypothetical protein U0S12_03565 [Fimbriimonadales bacterium]